jgi:hypothetical protein
LISRYKRVLEELRSKTGKLASEYIPELYFILKNEEGLSPEDCRARIEHDCEDIWTRNTVRKYLPPETKNATKRKAGKISAEVKNKGKEPKKPKISLAAVSGTGQNSAVVDSDGDNYGPRSVGINLTENVFVRQKEEESRTFQEIMDSRYSTKIFSDDHFSSLVADRQLDELRELLEDSSPDECISECVSKSLLLPSRFAEQISLAVHESRTSGAIPNFELEHNGICIISVRMCSNNRNLSQTQLSPEGNKKY